jgi:integrase
MVISMSRPWRHPDTGIWYYRGRVPADLKAQLAGKTVSIQVGDETSTVKISPIIKISLRTRDVSEARVRHSSVQTQLQERWAAARKGTISLTHKQIVALAGLWYRDLVLTNQDEPGDPDNWDIYQSLLSDGLAYFDPEGDGVEREPYDPKRGVRELSRIFNLDLFLEQRGLQIDSESRTKLFEAVGVALMEAAETLKRRGYGDYRPDRTVERFPTWEPDRPKEPIANRSGPTMTELLEGWAKESQPKQATLDLWRSYIASFISFIGHDNALSVTWSDVVNWKQHLLDSNNSVKTINDSKLAALKAVFNWAVANELLPQNPADKVSVRRGKKAGQRMLGFEKDEAATILRAAAQAMSPVYRWVPLLCAQSGARVSEVCQLRAEDIHCEDGIWYMSFRPEAGSLKNDGSERKVPLHPHVLEAGFLAFVRSKGRGPLFYDPNQRRPGAKKPQPKIVAKNVAAWVHRLGIEVGRKEHRKDPNHAWRHLFKTLGRDAGIQDSVLDAITGNSAPTVGREYGETWLTTASRAVTRIQLPGLTEPETNLAA